MDRKLTLVSAHLSTSTIPCPPLPVLRTNLLNKLTDLTAPLILLPDTYHLIADQSIHDGLKFLSNLSNVTYHNFLVPVYHITLDKKLKLQ